MYTFEKLEIFELSLVSQNKNYESDSAVNYICDLQLSSLPSPTTHFNYGIEIYILLSSNVWK